MALAFLSPPELPPVLSLGLFLARLYKKEHLKKLYKYQKY
jgi:hypothetical protein